MTNIISNIDELERAVNTMYMYNLPCVRKMNSPSCPVLVKRRRCLPSSSHTDKEELSLKRQCPDNPSSTRSKKYCHLENVVEHIGGAGTEILECLNVADTLSLMNCNRFFYEKTNQNWVWDRKMDILESNKIFVSAGAKEMREIIGTKGSGNMKDVYKVRI